MKKQFSRFLMAGILSAAVSVAFTACGGDSGTSGGVEHEKRSSSQEKVSSAKAQSSSSQAKLPDGLEPVTLDELSKNLNLGKMFGASNVYLATGVKHGLFSIWVPDTAWVVIASDFKDGVISFDKENSAYLGIKTAVSDSMEAFYKKGGKLYFAKDSEGDIKFSLDGKTYKYAENAQVAVSSSRINNADDLKSLKLSCKSEKSAVNYSFYEGRYLAEVTEGELVGWSAGYYDIHRGYLLMLPRFNNSKVSNIESSFLNTDYSMSSLTTNEKFNCKKEEFKFDTISKEKISGLWVAASDGLDWTLELNENGDYKLEAKKLNATEELKKGSWDIYGNLLVIQNLGCKNPETCVSAAKGVVKGFDSKNGFELDHDDPGVPEVPTIWTIPMYE